MGTMRNNTSDTTVPQADRSCFHRERANVFANGVTSDLLHPYPNIIDFELGKEKKTLKMQGKDLSI